MGPGLATAAVNKSFTSSTIGVATVAATSGQVTALNAGASEITYVGKDANGVVIEKGSTTVSVHAAAAIGSIPTVPAPLSVLGWGANPTGYTPVAAGQTIRWFLTNGTGSARINATSGAVGGQTAGDVSVMYKITETATGKVLYKSVPVTVTIPNTPRVNIGAPPSSGPYSLSTNVNLTSSIIGENQSVVNFSNPRSSDATIATTNISGPNPSGHVFLNVEKVQAGTVDITFDYTDINGATGTMTWTFRFQ